MSIFHRYGDEKALIVAQTAHMQLEVEGRPCPQTLLMNLVVGSLSSKIHYQRSHKFARNHQNLVQY